MPAPQTTDTQVVIKFGGGVNTDEAIGNYFFSTDTFLRNVEINNAMDKIATDFGLTWTPITL